LKEIKTDHGQFDPLLMDCTEVVPGEKDQVVETVSKGYYLYDNVLRPAKVKVGSGPNFHPREGLPEGGDPSDNSGS
jgi:molecular chaperone GrpE (heat shock protein)